MIVALALTLAAWFSPNYGWLFGAMYLAGLDWAIYDEDLVGTRGAAAGATGTV